MYYKKSIGEIRQLQWLNFYSYCYFYYLLVRKEDVVDYIVNIDFFADGGGDPVKLIHKLFEVLPHLSLGEDEMQGPEVVSGLGLDHCQGDGSPPMNSVTDDFSNVVRDVLQAGGDGFALGVC